MSNTNPHNVAIGDIVTFTIQYGGNARKITTKKVTEIEVLTDATVVTDVDGMQWILGHNDTTVEVAK